MVTHTIEMTNQRFPYLLKLIFWLIIIKALSVYGVYFAGIGLLPDEAMHWVWSKALHCGLYSKPPGITWEIACGTLCFGNTEVGVRIGALILSFALSLSIYFLARRGGLEGRFAFWSAIAFSVTPFAVFSTFLATADCGFALFWVLASAVFVKALLENRPHSFITIGIMVALGALFHWTIYLLWLPIIAFSLWQRKLNLRFIVGLIISAIPLIPSIIWNASHEWVTFRALLPVGPTADRAIWSGPLRFLVEQIELVSPLIFVLIIIATIGLARQLKKLPLSIAFYFWTFVGMFLFVLALSFFKRVHSNWAVASLLTAFPMLLAYAAMSRISFMRWLKAGMLLSIAIVVIAFLAPKYSLTAYRSNPWKNALGWDRLEKGLMQAGYDPQKHFLFSGSNKTVNILSFYGPDKKQAYFFNLKGVAAPKSSWMQKMAEKEVGKTGYFVTIVEGPQALQQALVVQEKERRELESYFSDVSGTLVIIPLYENRGQTVKAAVVIRAEGYNGRLPEPKTEK